MRIRFVMTVLMLLGLGGALKVNAQNWTGNAPSSVTGQQIVLYNVATGWYINGANLWGTQVSLLEYGQRFTIKSYSTGYSLMDANGKYMGWGSDDTSSLYTNTSSQTAFTFSQVSGTIYNIKCGNYYLVADGKDKAVSYTTTTPDATDENAQWKLVTYQNMLDYFTTVADAYQLGTPSVDATYLINAPGFPARNGGLASWNTSKGSTLAALQPGDDGNNDTGIYSPAGADGVVVGNGYEGGTRYGTHTTYSEDEDLFTLYNTPNNGKCERYLGGLWTVNIHGNYYVEQTIEVTASGWYEILCKGFRTGEAKLYAKTSNAKTPDEYGLFPSESTKDLVAISEDETPATYALAAQKMIDNGETYLCSVSIYVDLGTATKGTITLGIQGTSGWACFDDFQLKYFGKDSEKYFYFDEDNTDINVLASQVSKQKHTLYWRRSLKSDQWNSLVLPITMNRDNIRNTFGANTILSKLVGVDDENQYLINFKKVDLTDPNVTLEAGMLYIIKPMGGLNTLEENKEIVFDRVNGESSIEVKVTPTSVNPVIRVNNVTFDSFDGGTDGIITMTGYPHGNALASLSFMGSYVKNETKGVIPAGSFVLGASDGKWYHTTSDINSIKGFRSWLDASEVPAKTLAKLSFSFNGVQDGGVTAIDGVEISNPATPFSQNVYDLNGRIVNTKGNVDGLAKGIYIVNGKKVVIK